MNRIVQHLVIFFLITNVFTVQASPEKISVLSTIKPIHLIVTEIVGNKADAIQLIPDYASPHSYSFKPSDIRKIKNASLIFRVDEHMEAILNPALETHAQKDSLISFAEVEGIKLLPVMGGHDHEDITDQHEKVDLHIWTSPTNILVMAKNITKSLTKLDEKNAETYKANFDQFKTQVLQTFQDIKENFASVQEKPYLVFHNSWQYFSDYFGLQKAGVINMHEGISGDIKSIKNARKKIQSEGIVCVFKDPSVSPSRVKTLIEDFNINTAKIDVLANGVTIEKGAFIKWLSNMSTTVKNCLAQ